MPSVHQLTNGAELEHLGAVLGADDLNKSRFRTAPSSDRQPTVLGVRSATREPKIGLTGERKRTDHADLRFK